MLPTMFAKALGNGVPIGAVWATEDVASTFNPGDHGSTFGGQPLAASAAREVLRTMIEIDAPLLAKSRGEELTKLLNETAGIESVRGKGLLLAAELAKSGYKITIVDSQKVIDQIMNQD